MPLPIELEDLEEQLLAFGFNLALEFNIGGFELIKSINYAILKDFSLKYQLDALEILSLYKEMIAEMEI
ncbi:hypothetical protein [Helicobacter typhlonius]|uniref:hypothetical protein n=1 Tax=Helicobacter typhlonius TaxID=76936 RepID=UPI002FE40D8D